ncbi:MAG: type I-U CRISPR-associated protein Csx17 [Candidatus Eremiobacteraeota bacterium]|nr:type I-U CRISPR-associated protein Csx17 [Candidatus Eremiobacteraeota bacterium]
MMTVDLPGCKLEPFSSFFKSLGIFRILSEQVSDQIRGYWKEGIFRLEMSQNINIIDFFIDKYKPSPILSPWNMGSGFYPYDAKGVPGNRECVKSLNQISNSADPRVREYCETIEDIRRLPGFNEKLKCSGDKDKAYKSRLIQQCRNSLGENFLKWLDTAVIIDSSGELSFPPVMGSGGNDGNSEFSSLFMQMIHWLILDPKNCQKSMNLLDNSFYGKPCEDFQKYPIGFLYPGRAGGPNQGNRIVTENIPINPWEYVLAIEGVLCWNGSLSRRFASTGSISARSPFTVSNGAFGFSSASDDEKSRGEIWLPVWKNPVTLIEFIHFISEGRAELKSKRVRSAMQFAEAVSSLGTDRGVGSFARYALLERRGNAYVTVPAGVISVKERTHNDLVREFDPVFRQFRKTENTTLLSHLKMLREKIYQMLMRGNASAVIDAFTVLGRINKVLSIQDHKQNSINPIYSLTSRWIEAADDGSVELRIAAALASIQTEEKLGSLSAYLYGVDPINAYQWNKSSGKVSWKGSNFSRRLSYVLMRRMVDAARENAERNPLSSAVCLSARDVMAFIMNLCSDSLIEDLLFACFSIKDIRFMKTPERWKKPVYQLPVSGEYKLLKKLFLPYIPFSISGKKQTIKPEEGIIPKLLANRISDACRTAQRRLFSSGLNPPDVIFPDHCNGGRLAASMLIPVKTADLEF